ncbi:MAG: MFS transporter [Chryseobacterium sp.]|nr:MAG: MFS transporter [Chryseobacterium sp.]
MKKGFYALAMGGLAIGMAEFTMMGILPDISEDMQRDIPTTAHLISLYALGVVVGAPSLVLIASRQPPRKVLMWLMFIFFLFHGAFALAPSFASMSVTRFLSGLPHGAFFGVGTVVAAKMAEKGKEARSIAIMFAGMTVANLVGVPAGTYIGHHFSWRLTYGIISVIGLLAMVMLYLWLPAFPGDPSNRVGNQLRYFKSQEAWYLIALVSVGTGGLFAWLSYIAPLVREVSGLPAGRIPLIMTLVGLGMFFGNFIGGKLADSVSPSKAVMTSFGGMAICLLLVYFTSSVTWAAYPMAFVTGMVSFTIGAPVQMLLIRTAKGAETLAAAGGQASFNLGNTLGAYFGGLPITLGYAYNTPSLVGVIMATLGVLITFIFYRQIVLKKYR